MATWLPAQTANETLNVRGEPLLTADLLRNYVFLRAAREHEAGRAPTAEDLFARCWQPFEDPFWREEVRQGRLTRPRGDLFVQHSLANRLTADIQ